LGQGDKQFPALVIHTGSVGICGPFLVDEAQGRQVTRRTRVHFTNDVVQAVEE
jgi:hypothetical protein